MTISLLTPTRAFTMENDTTFERYKQQNKSETKEETLKNAGEACWRWLTSKEALDKADRATPLIDMITREMGDELDELLMTSMGSGIELNHMMVPRSPVWRKVYEAYVEKLKEFIAKKFTMELSEDANTARVNETILRKIEWVTMRHQGRRERPFPLLTKSLLPRLVDVLQRVQNAIAEVSLVLVNDD